MLALVVGGAVAGVLSARRATAREQRRAADLPDGVVDLLGVLSASGIVLDDRQSVVACSPTAVSHGLVRGRTVTQTPRFAGVVAESDS